MTRGEQFVSSFPLKQTFYDAHERRAYARRVEMAKGIIDNPDAIVNADRYFNAHMSGDPHQRRAAALWKALLGLPREEIVRALLEDSDAGDELRGSAPAFGVLAANSR